VIRVSVFEDNKHLRETLQLLLNSTEGYCCAGAWADCSDLIVQLRETPCEVVLMDIEMPGINGIQATRMIKDNFPSLQVLIQTVFFQDDYIFDAICAGASGYLLKSSPLDAYLQAISDVQAGGSPMSLGIARRVLELFKTNLQPTVPVNPYQLTGQERRVLQLLVEGKSYKMIAAELFVSLDTIKSHIRNIYAKLHVRSQTGAVSKAIQEKLV
jgi:DNA-binding NarL/FixJ family response regulator